MMIPKPERVDPLFGQRVRRLDLQHCSVEALRCAGVAAQALCLGAIEQTLGSRRNRRRGASTNPKYCKHFNGHA
jgi:hypothetical protein